MRKDKKAEFTRLPFEIDGRIDDSLVTAHAGVPLVIELFRATGAAGVPSESVPLQGLAKVNRRLRFPHNP